MLRLNFAAFCVFCARRMIYFLNIKVRWKLSLVHFFCVSGDRLVSHAINYSGKYWDLFNSAV
jgi:hypothetical protein